MVDDPTPLRMGGYCKEQQMHKANFIAALVLVAACTTPAQADDCPAAAGQSQVVLCEDDPGATVNSVRARGAGGNFAIGVAPPAAAEPRTVFEVLTERFRALAARLRHD